MYCNKCGNQIPDGSKFCPACGAQQGGGEPQWVSPDPVPYQGGYQNAQTPPNNGAGYQNYQSGQGSGSYQGGYQSTQTPPNNGAGYQSAQSGGWASPSPSAKPKSGKSKVQLIGGLAAVVVIAIVAVVFMIIKGQNEKKAKQECLSNYISGDLVELEALKDQIVDGVELVVYYSTEAAADIKSLCAQLTLKTMNVSNSLTLGSSREADSELVELTTLYGRFATLSSNVLDKLVAITPGDEDTARQIMELMDEAGNVYRQFQQGLKELADERGVSYRMETDVPYSDMVELLRAYFS